MIFLVELLRQLAVCYVLLTTNELNSDQETNVEITFSVYQLWFSFDQKFT